MFLGELLLSYLCTKGELWMLTIGIQSWGILFAHISAVYVFCFHLVFMCFHFAVTREHVSRTSGKREVSGFQDVFGRSRYWRSWDFRDLNKQFGDTGGIAAA